MLMLSTFNCLAFATLLTLLTYDIAEGRKMRRMLTKNEIKRIRIISGFTPDLRVKLHNVDKVLLCNFIDDNISRLVGVTDRPHWSDPDFDEYERYINRLVSQVVEGWF